MQKLTNDPNMTIKLPKKVIITAYFTSNIARAKGEIIWRKAQ